MHLQPGVRGMKYRFLALITIPLLAGACARGGEDDAGAALMDTTNSASIIGDTTTSAVTPAGPVAVPADSAAPAMDSAAGHEGHTMEPAPAEAHGDSAAH